MYEGNTVGRQSTPNRRTEGHPRRMSPGRWSVRVSLAKTKMIPENIGDDLTPQAVAVWVMDDGCRTRDTIILNTQSFMLDEQQRLLGEMKRRYKINGSINRDRNNFRLRFGRADAKVLSRIVAPYIIASFSAKIVPVSTASA